MLLQKIPSTVSVLAVASFLSGCAVSETDNSNDVPGLAAATAGSDASSSYVNSSADDRVYTSAGECVRTSKWSSELNDIRCDGPVEVESPGSVLVSYNGRALFDFDSALLVGAGQAELDRLTAKLNAQDKIEAIEVVGHTDNLGSEQYNQKLSENRAEAVRQYLQRSLNNVTVNTSGMGEAVPVADNETESGRRLNRRVDVKIAALIEN